MNTTAFVNVLSASRSLWERQFDFVGSLSGISGVELWIEQDLTPQDVLFLRGLVRDADLRVAIHAPFVGLALASHVETLRRASVDRVVQVARIGEALNAEVITCHSGPVGAWVKQNDVRAALAASLNEVVLSTSLKVTIENMPARSGGSIEPVIGTDDFTSLLERVPGLGITLDVGHCLQNAQDPADYISDLGGALTHVHLHDGIVGGRAHLKLGAGALDLSAVSAALDGRDLLVSLETVGDADTAASWQMLRERGLVRQPVS